MSSSLLAVLLASLCAFLLAKSCLRLGVALHGTAVWPVDGMLFALCVRKRGLDRSLILATGCLADYFARLSLQPPYVAGVFALCDGIEVVASLEILESLVGEHLDLSTSRHLHAFLLTAGCAAPMLAAVLEHALLRTSLTRDFAPSVLRGAVGDGLGMLILAPPILRITPESLFDLERALRRGRGPGSIAVLSGSLVLIFGQSTYPLFFLLPPALIYVAFELGQAGAAFALLASAAVTLVMSALGHGPVAMMSPDPAGRLTVLQVFLAAMTLAITPVAAALCRRDRLEEALRGALSGARTSEAATAEAFRSSRLAQQIAGIGEWRFDPATGTSVWSEETYRIHGLPPTFAGVKLEDAYRLYRPEDRASFEELLAETLKTLEPFEFKARFRREGESAERVVALRGEADLSDDGEVRAVVGVVRDITEEETARRRVEESELRYRAIAENATDIISRAGLDGRLLYVSPSVEAVTGFAPAELVGRSLAEFLDPEDAQMAADFWAEVLRVGRAPPHPFSFRLRRRSGGVIWLESNPTVLEDEEGRACELIDVIRDVSARVAIECELRAARDAAEAAAAVKSDFMANMSHEIRTPLTAILGFTRLLRDRDDLSEVAQGQIRRIAGAGDALLSIVNDVLDFSKLEAGQVRIERAPVDPLKLFRDTLMMFEPQAAQKGLTLRFAADRELPARLLLDAHRVRQIILNLLGNAVKFTDQGTVSLVIGYDRSNERLTAAVEDTGPGLGPSERARLFQRFSQVDASSTKRHGGTGLGLAISKGLAELMGGDIGVDSEPGVGSTFLFWIKAPADAGELDAPPPVEDDPSGLEGARILVVDDNPVNRELVRALLAPTGAEMAEATNGREAVELAQRMHFDAILMDLRMPVLDGAAAAAAIRAGEGPNRSAPILAFSADADLDDKRDVNPFDGRVRKPLTPSELLGSLAGALAPTRLRLAS